VPEGAGTRLTYSYRADVGGKVAAVGQRLMGTVTRVLIAEFFAGLERRVAPRAGPAIPRWLAVLLALLRKSQ
jgi:carbon monoxide dehydrogenase subunit G